ncbi:MAG TPA: hypothetical protein VFO19_09025 [Vicinamibacterales bacterium]|nr:hypothetical protein [Vicinamibacterales bacterium]
MIACLVVLAAASTAVSQAPPAPRAKVREYVRSQMGFTPSDWNALVRGRAVGRIIETGQGQDVNVFGGVRIAAPPARMIEQIRGIDRLERALGAVQVARFSDPPRLEDLGSLELKEDDFDELRDCRVGDCELQLPARTVERLRDVDWQRPDARDRAAGIVRELMLERLRAYQAGGLAALEPYADRDPPTPMAPEFLRIVVPSDVPFPVPALFDYVRRYPQALPAGAEDLFYWNTGEFGVKPTTRVNHVTIYQPDDAGLRAQGLRAVVVTRQIFSDHYFSATMEWRTIVEDPEGGEGFFLLYTTRSRVTGLRGIIGALLRPSVKGRARAGMERYLTRTKAAVEGRPQPR